MSAHVDDAPLYFGREPTLFGVLTLPRGECCARGVVICPPFGHENICAYRPLRTLARQLGGAGWPVLRFDWPGTGDSADGDSDDYPAVWSAAVRAACDELRRRSGVDDVVVAGLRIGATLGLLAALEDEGVSGAVLLGPYASGRAYLRELRAFQALAGTEGSGHPSSPLPVGATEASGFLISSAEREAMMRVDLHSHELAPLAGRRVLVVSVQEAEHDALRTRLAGAGASVTAVCAPALAHAWEGTATSVMPKSVGSIVEDWLAAAQTTPRRSRPFPIAGGELLLPGCVDRPLVLATARGERLTGVLCEPRGARTNDSDCVVFLNAGRVRRIGPNRLVTSFARSWAAAGLSSLRVDLGGIGDSDGTPADDDRYVPFAAGWYGQRHFEEDVAAVLDDLAARGMSRFVLAGLCSGAKWGFDAALADARVAGLVLLNPRILFRDTRAVPLEALRTAGRLLRRPGQWRRLKGNGLRALPLDALRGALLTLAGRGDPAWHRDLIHAALRKLRARGVSLTIVFSAGDPGIPYFERHLGAGWREELGREGVDVRVVDGVDHMFRPLWSHAVLRRIIEEHLEELSMLPVLVPR